MSHKTKIEWCDMTWNPITGCSPISIGCENCYAYRMAVRFKERFGHIGNGHFKVMFQRDRLKMPLKYKKPKRIFVNSMGDLFHNDVQVDWIDEIFEVIEKCPQHTFLILTKRPYNIEEKLLVVYHNRERRVIDYKLSNVWFGVTVEDSGYLFRIKELFKIPAAVRFVSVEPMLGAIDLTRIGFEPEGMKVVGSNQFHYINSLNGYKFTLDHKLKGAGTRQFPKLDWVICGAETGPGARPFNLDWARDLRNQCKFAGIPFFFKSAGSQGIPKDLDIREFPKNDQ